MNHDKNTQVLILFFILVFLLAIVAVLLYLALPLIFLQILIPWAPNISAILLVVFYLKEKSGVRRLASGWKKWRVSFRWYLLAHSPMFVFFLSVGIYLGSGGIPPGPNPTPLFGLSFPALAILAIFTGATGEELGWRGFALPKLQMRYSALTSSFMLGFYWGVWHIPIWILSGSLFTIESTFFFVANAILYSIIITFICNNTRGSVLLASMYHWSVNVWGEYVTSYLGLISRDAMYWIMTPITAMIAITLVVVYGPERLSRDSSLGYPELIEPESDPEVVNAKQPDYT
ncbi:MAG: CPBP family intramembrane metalloprotease [Candidatus Thorarchaeota archaeon]|nr:MAG: CPBP family intramembrane metalloprotease [Candidatus Thorarchaeota archaeon]